MRRRGRGEGRMLFVYAALRRRCVLGVAVLGGPSACSAPYESAMRSYTVGRMRQPMPCRTQTQADMIICSQRHLRLLLCSPTVHGDGRCCQRTRRRAGCVRNRAGAVVEQHGSGRQALRCSLHDRAQLRRTGAVGGQCLPRLPHARRRIHAAPEKQCASRPAGAPCAIAPGCTAKAAWTSGAWHACRMRRRAAVADICGMHPLMQCQSDRAHLSDIACNDALSDGRRLPVERADEQAVLRAVQRHPVWRHDPRGARVGQALCAQPTVHLMSQNADEKAICVRSAA